MVPGPDAAGETVMAHFDFEGAFDTAVDFACEDAYDAVLEYERGNRLWSVLNDLDMPVDADRVADAAEAAERVIADAVASADEDTGGNLDFSTLVRECLQWAVSRRVYDAPELLAKHDRLMATIAAERAARWSALRNVREAAIGGDA